MNRVQVTAGVMSRDATVLVCQRAAGSWHAGKWEFPGGKVELGETLESGMRRELREELGIEVEVGRRLWRTTYQYPEREPFDLTFFFIPKWTGAVRNQEFADIRWIRVGQVGELDFLEGDREFVSALDAGEVRLV
jgi:8-oxo-dGTP diphosphatase